MVQHCIFDLYGTLADIHTDEEDPVFWQRMAEEYARWGARFAPEALHRQYLQLVQREEARMAALRPDCIYPPEIRLEKVFAGLFALAGVPAEDAEVIAVGQKFREYSTEYIRLYAGVPEMLEALRASGRKVWLLSNAQRLFTMPELDRLGLTAYFDGIYLSSDYGCKKPDPRFFRALLEERQIDPARAVMVGNDGTCDIGGGRAAGLRTVYIRSNLTPREPLPPADCILEEMDIPRVQEILLSL